MASPTRPATLSDHPSRRWWTFAGGQANAWLACALGELADQITPGDLHIRLASNTTPAAVRGVLEALEPEEMQLGDHIAQGAIDRLKFAEALPESYARRVVERRMRDDGAIGRIKSMPLRVVAIPQGSPRHLT